MDVVVTINVYRAMAVCLALIGFGVWYDRAVGRMERRREDRGYTAFLVVFGVAVTVVGFFVIVSLSELAVVLFGCFCASGLPMIVGSMRRHCIEREREEEAMREIVRGSFGGD